MSGRAGSKASYPIRRTSFDRSPLRAPKSRARPFDRKIRSMALVELPARPPDRSASNLSPSRLGSSTRNSFIAPRAFTYPDLCQSPSPLRLARLAVDDRQTAWARFKPDTPRPPSKNTRKVACPLFYFSRPVHWFSQHRPCHQPPRSIKK